MPAKDRYHDKVVVTLQKAGWVVFNKQIAIILEHRRLWIDIGAESADRQQIILIEVKGDIAGSAVEYLAHVAGQYALYQAALQYLAITSPLYLAVPISVYRGILSEALGTQVITFLGIRLLVFDPDKEEIVAWI